MLLVFRGFFIRTMSAVAVPAVKLNHRRYKPKLVSFEKVALEHFEYPTRSILRGCTAVHRFEPHTSSGYIAGPGKPLVELAQRRLRSKYANLEPMYQTKHFFGLAGCRVQPRPKTSAPD